MVRFCAEAPCVKPAKRKMKPSSRRTLGRVPSSRKYESGFQSCEDMISRVKDRIARWLPHVGERKAKVLSYWNGRRPQAHDRDHDRDPGEPSHAERQMQNQARPAATGTLCEYSSVRVVVHVFNCSRARSFVTVACSWCAMYLFRNW